MSAPESLTSAVSSDPAARPSEADREHALGVLREGAGQGRLSHDTFMRRMELVLTARSAAELDAVLADLPAKGAWASWPCARWGACRRSPCACARPGGPSGCPA